MASPLQTFSVIIDVSFSGKWIKRSGNVFIFRQSVKLPKKNSSIGVAFRRETVTNRHVDTLNCRIYARSII